MRHYVVEAVVLKNINYGDSNKIYTLYTRQNGKITAVARGIRKLQSRRAGSMDTLNHIKAKIYEDSRGYKTIQEVEAVNTFKDIKADLSRVFRALYILDILNKFHEVDDGSEVIFNNLINTLNMLEVHRHPSELLVAHFEIILLKLLGFQMNVSKCSICEKKLSSEWDNVKFNYSLGGLICDTCEETGFFMDIQTALLLSRIEQKEFGNYSQDLYGKSMVQADAVIRNYMTYVSDEVLRYSKTYNILQGRILNEDL
ncbi:DNA repair protein RecO [candidate division WWE3 bacterium]|uniref:DNA repair protein RecO n=1 Tax=candidate division WWE3 bacterium TaxID=2053526 RepID=A0A3A4ZE88_UNCKA|nr:MAG: DNA repair protein RecO [candidate division WWE3 bacterium]